MAPDVEQIEYVLTTGNDEEKLAALEEMRVRIVQGEPAIFFDIAARHVADSSRDVRWRAIIVLGEYIPSGRRNNEIWSVIVRLCGIDDDLQDALATVLLEHLLEYDFDRTVDKIEAVAPEKAGAIRDLATRCWNFGHTESRWQRLRHLIAGDADAEPEFGSG